MTLRIYTSTTRDGSMKSLDADQSAPRVARTAFLEKHRIKPLEATLLRLSYGGEDYRRYLTLTDHHKGDGIVHDSTLDVDALVISQPHHAILLPLADCIGAVLHDEIHNILMVSHLGRHNLEQFGGTASVTYLKETFNTDPKNLKVWLSPAAGPQNYPLFTFNNRGLHDVATEQLIAGGVPSRNIDASPVDTTTDTNYFSHSEFLKGNRQIDGRFCIVAIMT